MNGVCCGLRKVGLWSEKHPFRTVVAQTGGRVVTAGNLHPAVKAYAAMASAYATGDPETFNAALSDYGGWLQEHFAARVGKTHVESIFNFLQPFYSAMVIYVLVFIMACASWLIPERRIERLLVPGDALAWCNQLNVIHVYSACP